MAPIPFHQQTSFANPSNGDTLDATIVKANDNAIVSTYNSHDADQTIHVQSSLAAARPAAGVTGRLWFTSDDRRMTYDTGAAWVTQIFDAADLTGTLPSARLTGSYTGVTGVGTVTAGTWNATTIGVAYGGTGLTTTPANGELLIGNGTGYTVASLTAGSNVTITPAAGAITIASTNPGGDVVGPASSTANAVPRFSNTGGKLLVNSGVTVDASNNVGGVVGLTASGTLSGAAGSFTGNVGAATVTTTGNVGIGTATPMSRFQVTGGTLATAATSSGLLVAGTLSAGRLVTGGSSNVQAIHTYLDDNAYEISAGSSSTFVSGIGITSRSYSGTAQADSVLFFTRSAERARVAGTGELLVGTASVTSGGGILQVSSGITFPATAVASSNANTLDDYREATFTPTGNGVTFTLATGSYTRIGRMVQFRLDVTYPSTANPTSSRISGLPFAPSTGTAFSVWSDKGTQVQALSSGSAVFLYDVSGVEYTNANMSTKSVSIAGCYHV